MKLPDTAEEADPFGPALYLYRQDGEQYYIIPRKNFIYQPR